MNRVIANTATSIIATEVVPLGTPDITPRYSISLAGSRHGVNYPFFLEGLKAERPKGILKIKAAF